MTSIKPSPPITSVNLEKVEALNPKRTLAFINHWVVHMVTFLNKFASVCEDKLSEVDAKLQRTEDTLAILEAKLASIPDLENITASSTATAGSHEAPPPEVHQPGPSNESAAVPVEEVNDEASATAEELDVLPISQDPEFATFFKMVSVGVPPAAVKLKMSAQGLDPDLLDNPDAPSPSGAKKQERVEPKSDSDDDLSSWSE